MNTGTEEPGHTIEYFTVTGEDILQGRMGRLEFDRMMDLAEIALDCGEIQPGLYRRIVTPIEEPITYRWERV